MNSRVKELQESAYKSIRCDDIESALSHYSKAIFLDGERSELHSGKGDVYLSIGDIRMALVHFRKALKLNRDSSPMKEKLAMVCDTLGCLYFEQGDLVRAEPLFNEAVSLDQRKPHYLLHRTMLHVENSAWNKVIQDLNLYFTLKQDDADAYILRGKLFWKLGMAENASKDFERASAIDPGHNEVQHFRKLLSSESQQESSSASNFMLRGNYEVALRMIKKSLQLSPKNLQLLIQASQSSRQLGYLDEALVFAETAHSYLKSSNVVLDAQCVFEQDVLFEKCLVLRDQGLKLMTRPKSAGAALLKFDIAIDLAPTISSLYIHRGDCYVTLGKLSAARDNFEIAKKATPCNAELAARFAMIHYYTGIIYYNAREYAKAADEFTDAISQNPTQSEYFQSRAEAMICISDSFDARSDFTRALELDPQNIKARQWLESNKVQKLQY